MTRNTFIWHKQNTWAYYEYAHEQKYTNMNEYKETHALTLAHTETHKQAHTHKHPGQYKLVQARNTNRRKHPGASSHKLRWNYLRRADERIWCAVSCHSLPHIVVRPNPIPCPCFQLTCNRETDRIGWVHDSPLFAEPNENVPTSPLNILSFWVNVMQSTTSYSRWLLRLIRTGWPNWNSNPSPATERQK